MQQKLGIKCDLCNEELFENVRFFTIEYAIEHERPDGYYEVEDVGPLLICCESCSTKHLISEFTEKAMLEIINTINTTATKSKISAINNRYDCCICGKRIPNQTKTLTITSGFETFRGSIIDQEALVLEAAVCIDCESKFDVQKQMEDKLTQFIQNNKKPNLAVVK